MAKISLRSSQWGTIFASVENRGKTLEDEAIRLNITVKDLIACGDEKFSHNPKRWEECKRLSEKREKKQTPKKRKPAVSQDSTSAPKLPEPAPTNASTPAPAPAPEVPAASTNPMEDLLRRKEKLQKELADRAAWLKTAESILDIRQGVLADAKAVIEKAQLVVKKAEADEAEAKAAVQQAQEQQTKAQADLQRVEEEILRNQVYLVAPWFSGELPALGTFISTVEMKGVTLEEVPEEYLPDASVDDVLLFDFVPDYKKARIFVGLVAKFELEGAPYRLLVSDERVKELLKMYIG